MQKHYKAQSFSRNWGDKYRDKKEEVSRILAINLKNKYDVHVPWVKK